MKNLVFTIDTGVENVDNVKIFLKDINNLDF